MSQMRTRFCDFFLVKNKNWSQISWFDFTVDFFGFLYNKNSIIGFGFHFWLLSRNLCYFSYFGKSNLFMIKMEIITNSIEKRRTHTDWHTQKNIKIIQLIKSYPFNLTWCYHEHEFIHFLVIEKEFLFKRISKEFQKTFFQ